MTHRLLFVFNPFLGWKTYAKQLRRVLDRRDDVEAHVFTLRPTIWHSTILKRHNMSWTSYLTRHVDPVTAYRGWLGRSIRAEVERLRPQVIHYGPHWPAAATAFAYPAIPFTAVLDCTRFNMNEYLGKAVWTLPDLDREVAVLGRAARLYPMSSWTAASLSRDCGVPEGRIRVMPPSIDLAHVGKAPASDSRPKILFVGNDFRRKGGDRLHRWVTGPLAGTCELHIVSEDPEARVDGENVIHHGRVEHAELLGRLMPSMDIFCLPTRSDMSPHVLVEAAAAGLPSVTSALGGIPDLVVEGRTGFIVPPSDDAAFVARLKELIDSPTLRRDMRSAALQLAWSNFDASQNYDSLIDDLVYLTRA